MSLENNSDIFVGDGKEPSGNMAMAKEKDNEEVDLEEFAEFENEQEFFKALGKTPLVKNPFFVRSMADNVFNGNGTEGIEAGMEIIGDYQRL